MFSIIVEATFETLFLVLGSLLIGLLIGIPLGALLFFIRADQSAQKRFLYKAIEVVINSFRALPYLILTILLIPFTRIVTGSSIGLVPALIPLALSSILLVARIVEESFCTLPEGLIETGISLGASKRQIFVKILLPEAAPNITSGITLVVISLIGFSTMAGVVGGGGLGDLAIRYGYQRYQTDVLFSVVIVLILLVQSAQVLGTTLANTLGRRN